MPGVYGESGVDYGEVGGTYGDLSGGAAVPSVNARSVSGVTRGAGATGYGSGEYGAGPYGGTPQVVVSVPAVVARRRSLVSVSDG